VSNAQKELRVNGRFGGLINDIPAGLNYTFYTERMGHPRPVFAWRSKFYDFLYKADPNAPIRTLTAKAGQYSGPFHWNSRRLATSELKRLQTIPDSYKIVGSRPTAREQIGNSVPPQMARILALSILNQVFGIALPFRMPLLSDSQSIQTRKHKLAPHEKRVKWAISRLKKNYVSRLPRKRSYRAFLSDKFGWTFLSDASKALHIAFLPSKDEWHFAVSRKPENFREYFRITIRVAPGQRWSLGIDRIILSGAGLSSKMFTGAWKALEYELARREIKADLVQFSGYFAYKPGIRCHLSFNKKRKTHKHWRVLQAVVNGVGTGEIL
jgi:DNA (cytosine-5)-methyltransferase 1